MFSMGIRAKESSGGMNRSGRIEIPKPAWDRMMAASMDSQKKNSEGARPPISCPWSCAASVWALAGSKRISFSFFKSFMVTD